MIQSQNFTSVWEDIEDTPEEAENMKIRSSLMMNLQNHITKNKMTQAQAGALFRVTQPRVSDLMRSRINLFAIDSLIDMASAAGFRVEVKLRQVA